jgi:hypothetical protein
MLELDEVLEVNPSAGAIGHSSKGSSRAEPLAILPRFSE